MHRLCPALLHEKINWLRSPSIVFSLATPVCRKAIDVTLLIFIGTLSLQMSTFLRLTLYSSLDESNDPSRSNFLPSVNSDIPIVPTLVSIPTLHTYQRRTRPQATHAPQDSSPALPDSLAPHSTPELPITLRKDSW